MIDQRRFEFSPGIEENELHALNKLLKNIKADLRASPETCARDLRSGLYFARPSTTRISWDSVAPDKMSTVRGTLLLSVAMMLQDSTLHGHPLYTKMKELISTVEFKFFEAMTTSKIRQFLKYLKDGFSSAWEALSVIKLLLPHDYERIRDSLGLEAYRRIQPNFNFSVLTLQYPTRSPGSCHGTTRAEIRAFREAVGTPDPPLDGNTTPLGFWVRISPVREIDRRALHWIHVPCTNVSIDDSFLN